MKLASRLTWSQSCKGCTYLCRKTKAKVKNSPWAPGRFKCLFLGITVQRGTVAEREIFVTKMVLMALISENYPFSRSFKRLVTNCQFSFYSFCELRRNIINKFWSGVTILRWDWSKRGEGAGLSTTGRFLPLFHSFARKYTVACMEGLFQKTDQQSSPPYKGIQKQLLNSSFRIMAYGSVHNKILTESSLILSFIAL